MSSTRVRNTSPSPRPASSPSRSSPSPIPTAIDEIDHVIPGNDDAIRAVKLITSKIADAALEARQLISPEELTAAPEIPVTAVEFGAEEEEEEEKGFAGMPTIDEAEFYEDEALDDEK